MGRFATTRWSLILESRADPQVSRDALEYLCGAYRAPVLSYVRQRGYALDEAEDLTQGFFAHFISARIHHAADPARGSFRAYLLSSIRNFLADAASAAHAGKRGGGVARCALDDTALTDDRTPVRAFERHWALTVLARALQRLREEARVAGKHALFEQLHEYLVEQPGPEDYARLAERLGMRRNSLAVAVHRLRTRLRELVREELALTLGDGGDVELELVALREALGADAAAAQVL